MSKPFMVAAKKECLKCGRGASYSIVGPDGILRAGRYNDRYGAQYHVDEMNEAFRMGAESVKKQRGGK